MRHHQFRRTRAKADDRQATATAADLRYVDRGRRHRDHDFSKRYQLAIGHRRSDHAGHIAWAGGEAQRDTQGLRSFVQRAVGHGSLVCQHAGYRGLGDAGLLQCCANTVQIATCNAHHHQARVDQQLVAVGRARLMPHMDGALRRFAGGQLRQLQPRALPSMRTDSPASKSDTKRLPCSMSANA